jgi:hypothetical protein
MTLWKDGLPMGIEDKQMSRLLQREVHKRKGIDWTDAKINVQRGSGSISGIVREILGENIDWKQEARIIQDMARKIGLREIFIDARFERGSKK